MDDPDSTPDSTGTFKWLFDQSYAYNIMSHNIMLYIYLFICVCL